MNLPEGYQTDEVTRLEANLDDLSPEITGATMVKLMQAGALDAWLTPIQMKKGRPGTLLSVLCEEGAVAKMVDVLFEETTTFGLRIEKVLRLKLERRFTQVPTPFGEVTVKEGMHRGKVVQRAPEFESCRKLADASGQPLRLIYEAAVRAAQ